MATNTYKTFLMEGTGTGTLTWAKLADIVDYPDLGGVPDALDVTTLSDGQYKYIPGIKKSGDNLSFKAWYDPTTYGSLKAKEGTERHFALWMGGTVANEVATPTGSEGKFSFDGYLTVALGGAGVNAPRPMTITITRSGPIAFTSST